LFLSKRNHWSAVHLTIHVPRIDGAGQQPSRKRQE
jgi:hypothetical protein